MAKKRKRKSVDCKRVRVRGHTKTICRSKKTGRIVSTASRKMVCPKTWRGKKVRYSRKAKRCYVEGKNRRTGQSYRRFVKKVRRDSPRARK